MNSMEYEYMTDFNFKGYTAFLHYTHCTYIIINYCDFPI